MKLTEKVGDLFENLPKNIPVIVPHCIGADAFDGCGIRKNL